MSWNDHKLRGSRHPMEQLRLYAGQQLIRVTEDRGKNWITSGSAHLTFHGNRYLPWHQGTQNLDHRHPDMTKIQNNSLGRAAAAQLDWQRQERITGRIQPGWQDSTPFYSQASSGEPHAAAAGTAEAVHWCMCLESHWGLCEGFVQGTKSQCSRAAEWRDKYSVASNLITHTSSSRKARLY